MRTKKGVFAFACSAAAHLLSELICSLSSFLVADTIEQLIFFFRIQRPHICNELLKIPELQKGLLCLLPIEPR